MSTLHIPGIFLTFTWILLLNSHNHPIKLSFFPFYIWENWATKTFSNTPKIIQLVHYGTRIQNYTLWFYSPCSSSFCLKSIFAEKNGDLLVFFWRHGIVQLLWVIMWKLKFHQNHSVRVSMMTSSRKRQNGYLSTSLKMIGFLLPCIKCPQSLTGS